MWEEVFRLAASNGLWAVMFCVLLIYQLKDSRAREHKYQDVINSLTDRLNTVHAISEDIEQIRKEMQRKNKKSAATAIAQTAINEKSAADVERIA